VGLRVTDDSGTTGTMTVSVDVTQPPLAALVVSPSAVRTGEPVRFDASASVDPDGSIVRYEWDLDGNGSYEADTGVDPHATQSYANHGVIPVRVRVTDDDGATGIATATVTVSDPPAPPPPPPPPPSPSSTTSTPTATASAAASASPNGEGSWSASGSGSNSGSTSGEAPSSAPPGPLRVSLDGAAVQKARVVARSGLRVACTTDRAATCALRAEVGVAAGRRMGLRVKRRVKTVVVATARVQADAGRPGAVALRLRKRPKRPIAVTVRATITAASGERAEAVRTIAVR
jgi:hypothetical protein